MKHYMKRKRPVADWFLFISWKHTQFNKFCRKVIADANYKGLVFEGDGSLRMTDSLARAQDSDICALDRYYCHPRGGFGTVGCKVFPDKRNRGHRRLLAFHGFHENKQPPHDYNGIQPLPLEQIQA